MANKNGWDFMIFAALLFFLYHVITKLAPLCKEMSVEHKPDGHIKFTALTHDKEEEIGDANPPLVLQGTSVLPERIMDLPGWGEGPAASFKPGETFAVTLDDVIIERVIPLVPGRITIAGIFNGRTVFYSIGPLDEKTLPKVGKIVDDNRGKPLLSIGTIEIPADEN